MITLTNNNPVISFICCKIGLKKPEKKKSKRKKNGKKINIYFSSPKN